MVKKNLSRRQFVSLSATGVVAVSLTPELLAQGSTPQRVNIDNMMIINGLGGISNQNLWARSVQEAGGDIGQSTFARIRSIDQRAIDDTQASGTTAINVTLGYVVGPADPYESTVDDIARWNALIRQYPEDLMKVWTAGDLQVAKTNKKIGIIFGFQNAAAVGHKPERVQTFSDLGVRIIQLTYNNRNPLGDGSGVAQDQGLSPLGATVVEALNDARVLVDLSHSSAKTCLGALKVTQAPLTISHTGCRALTDIPRNKSDEELRKVAQGGGVVGIYFMPFLASDGQAKATDVVAHIEHALKVCGEDHVGIGTDGDATSIDDMDSYRSAIAGELQQRRQSGVSTAGEANSIVPLVADLMGPTQYQKLADMLHSRGHSSGRIEKILGGNFQRLMAEVW